MTPLDNTTLGVLALLRDIPKAIEQYKGQIAELDKEHAEKVANHKTADEAKVAVEAEVEAHRTKLMAGIDADIQERVVKRDSVDEGTKRLLADRQDLLTEVSAQRAELNEMKGETERLLHERQMELSQVQAQIDSAKAQLKQEKDAIAQLHRELEAKANG